MTGGSAPKRKGSQFERDIVAYLRSAGIEAERAYGAGRPDDVGDIELAGWCIEAKACQRLELAAWVDEAERERRAAGAENVCVVVKRRGKGTAESYVVTTLSQFANQLTTQPQPNREESCN